MPPDMHIEAYLTDIAKEKIVSQVTSFTFSWMTNNDLIILEGRRSWTQDLSITSQRFCQLAPNFRVVPAPVHLGKSWDWTQVL